MIERIKLNFNIKAPYKKQNYTYENILYDQVQQFANYLADKNKELQFNIPQVQIKRNDPIDMRDTIINMSSEERKQLGISKTTLWYMKKNLLEGKKIKIYDKTQKKFTME